MKSLFICGLAAIVVLPSISGADPHPTLEKSSARYGYVAVDHWFTLESLRQLDRAFFYQTNSSDSRLDGLRKAFASADQTFGQARVLYKEFYTQKKTNDLPRLNVMLEQVAVLDSTTRRGAESLLDDLGHKLNQGKFEVLPVDDGVLRKDWTNVVGKNFQPTRILFGSTATPGDTRVEPLRFDFCKGVFGFYAPMSGPGQIEMSEPIRKRTDPAYAWMRSAQVGYHYWAGVYNNQNTYLAPWFLKQHADDPDIWMQLADGKVLKGSGDWGQLNIWNPSVQAYLKDYCSAQSKALHDDGLLLCYDYTAEPHPFGGQPPEPPNLPQYSGYNASAMAAFHDYLKKKFGTITKLNSAWRSAYTGFDAIQPPEDPFVKAPERATPLSYEFERFRCDSHTQFWKMAYDAYRKFDKSKPVAANAGMYMSGWPVEALDAYQLQKSTAADWIDMHMNNFWPNLPEQIYLYSLCRLTGKTPVQFEYIWSFPRPAPFDDMSESDFRATCEASVWRNLVWGKKAMVFFDVAYDWPTYHNAFLDSGIGYSILRPSICVVPVLKRKALRFNDMFMNTEVIVPPIAILQPTTSVLNSPPVHPNRAFSFHSSAAGDLHKLLFPKNYPFLYLPEEAVIEDGYSLAQHKLILLPQGPYLPEKLTEQLLRWIEKGGTLISAGPPALWNPYGQPDERLVKRAFGPSEFKDEQPGQWKWLWTLSGANSDVETVRDKQGKLLAASARLGKGRLLASVGNYSQPELQNIFYRTVDGAIGPRPATCQRDSFELVLREDKRKHLYLCVLNPDARRSRTDTITVAGAFPHCQDLGVGSGLPIPVLTANDQTDFQLALAPGEGTVIFLQH